MIVFVSLIAVRVGTFPRSVDTVTKLPPKLLATVIDPVLLATVVALLALTNVRSGIPVNAGVFVTCAVRIAGVKQQTDKSRIRQIKSWR
jgi:hypothetical protein